MTAPVFISVAAADAALGDVVTVTGAEAHHALRSQRRATGDHVTVVDGAGTRVDGPIVAVRDGEFDVRADQIGHDADRWIVLVQALAKGGRDEQAIEAATEIGATRIVPWASRRAIVQWRGPKAEKGREKWASTVLSATKQSRRALVPEVSPMLDTAGLVAAVRDAVAAGETVLVMHEVASTPLATTELADGPVWVVVGPEGGIADDEVDALVDAGARAVRLGPYVQRASSAGPAAVALIAARGDAWRTQPSDPGIR